MSTAGRCDVHEEDMGGWREGKGQPLIAVESLLFHVIYQAESTNGCCLRAYVGSE